MMGHTDPRVRFQRIGCLVLVIWALTGSGVQAQQNKIDELVQMGAAQVREGKFARAIKTLEQANEMAAGQSIPALVGLAMAYNGAGEPDKALPVARQAVESSAGNQLYWLGLGELTLALAATSQELTPELESAFDAIRGLLVQVPGGSMPNRLRQRLCWARGLLPASSPEGLATTEKHFSRDEVHAEKGGLTPPRQIFSPTITVGHDDQRRLGESERAVIRAAVDVDGCVLGGEIIEDSNDYWTELVFDALRRFVFEPARIDDQPVKAFTTIRFDYPSQFQSTTED